MSCKAAIRRNPPKQGVKVPPQGQEIFYKEMNEKMAQLKTVVSVKDVKNKEQKTNFNLFEAKQKSFLVVMIVIVIKLTY